MLGIDTTLDNGSLGDAVSLQRGTFDICDALREVRIACKRKLAELRPLR